MGVNIKCIPILLMCYSPASVELISAPLERDREGRQRFRMSIPAQAQGTAHPNVTVTMYQNRMRSLESQGSQPPFLPEQTERCGESQQSCPLFHQGCHRDGMWLI